RNRTRIPSPCCRSRSIPALAGRRSPLPFTTGEVGRASGDCSAARDALEHLENQVSVADPIFWGWLSIYRKKSICCAFLALNQHHVCGTIIFPVDSTEGGFKNSNCGGHSASD